MTECEHTDGGTDEQGGVGKRLKRRGILSAAAAVVAGIVAKQAAQPVAAGVDGDVVAAGLTVVSAATGLRNNLGGNFVTPTLTCMRGPDNAFPPPGNYGANAALVADSKSSFGSYGVWALGDTGVLAQGVTLGVMGTAGSGIGVSGSGDLTGVQGAINPASPAAQQTFAVIGRNSLNRADAVGVLGTADHGVGVYGQTGAGLYGVRGDAGPAPGGAGLLGVSTVASGIAFGSVVVAPATTAGFFNGRTVVQGDLMVTGTKNCAVKDAAGEYRLLHCVEAPEAWFEDFGKAPLASGKAAVALDPVFAALVHGEDYHVFLTEYDSHNDLYVTKQAATGFEVRAKSGAGSGTFSWRVVAKRKDAGGERLAKFALPHLAPPAVAPPIPGHPESPATPPRKP